MNLLESLSWKCIAVDCIPYCENDKWSFCVLSSIWYHPVCQELRAIISHGACESKICLLSEKICEYKVSKLCNFIVNKSVKLEQKLSKSLQTSPYEFIL